MDSAEKKTHEHFGDDLLVDLVELPVAVNAPRRRWYDQYPLIASAFAEIQTMSVEHQDLFGQVIFSYYDWTQEKKKHDGSLRSLGVERAQGLHKLQKKRRKEDHEIILFKALKALYLIDEEERVPIAEKISYGILCLKKYSVACWLQERAEDIDEVKTLFKKALAGGMEAGIQYLISLKLNVFEEELFEDEIKAQAIESLNFTFISRIDSRIAPKIQPQDEERILREHEATLTSSNQELKLH